MTTTTCAIWGTPAEKRPTECDGQHIASPRAGGEYFISGTARAMADRLSEPEKVRLTTWLIEQRRMGFDCAAISSATISEAKQQRSPGVHDRADSLLRYLDEKSDLIGTIVKFYQEDNTKNPEPAYELLAWTSSTKLSEVITLCEYCASEKWIEHRTTERAGTSTNTVHEIMLRPPGYARLAELDGSKSASQQAFVAMWFDASMTEAYELGIAPAIRDAGYEPMRIDNKQHDNKIDDEIIAEIRRSRFLVADFTQGETGARGGVYYEAGFAQGLNIPVIFCCKKDTISKVHFDTRQYNHITWADPDALRERLKQRISATVGDGPLRQDRAK